MDRRSQSGDRDSGSQTSARDAEGPCDVAAQRSGAPGGIKKIHNWTIQLQPALASSGAGFVSSARRVGTLQARLARKAQGDAHAAAQHRVLQARFIRSKRPQTGTESSGWRLRWRRPAGEMEMKMVRAAASQDIASAGAGPTVGANSRQKSHR